MRHIHFYLPRKRSKTNTIRFKLTINYETITGSTNLKIETKNWDFKNARTKPSFKFSSQFNITLNRLEERLTAILYELGANSELTKNHFLASYYGENNKPNLSMSVFLFYENYFVPNKRKEGRSSETIKSYLHSMSKLEKYCAFRKFSKDTLTLKRIMEYDFYLDYIGYLNLDCGHMLNYQGGLIKQLITVINHAKELGIHNQNLPKNYKKPSETIEPIILEKTELEALEFSDKLSDLESIARDWFVISCKTGLRISDFLELQHAHFNFEKNMISLRTQKNSNKLIDIPISESIHRILKKNNGKLPPNITEALFNSNIKEACKKAGINSSIIIERKIKGRIQSAQVPKYSKVSAHCGRRTFATHAFQDGLLELPELMLITGHSDLSTLMLYIRVDNKKAAMKMQRNMDKLNW